jgi:ethanolamine utilization protein EutM
MESLGFVEVVGFVPAIEAADTMAKSSDVTIVAREGIGGGLVTIIVKGDVGAVKTAVDAGAGGPREKGQLFAAHVIARPSEHLLDLLRSPATSGGGGEGESLGLIEVKGLVPALEAADTALKAANIRLVSRANVGMGLISVTFSGEVAAVKSALEAAAGAAAKIGEVVSSGIIAKPEETTYRLVVQPVL